MITVEGLNKADRKAFKAKLKGVSGIMFNTLNIAGYTEPKHVEVIFFHQDPDEKWAAIKTVRQAINETRTEAFNRA